MVAGAETGSGNREQLWSRDRTTEQSERPQDAKVERTAARLHVVFGPDADATREPVELVRDALLTVGRDVAEPGLALRDPHLSRLHFRVVWDARCHHYRVGDAG